MVKFFGDVFNPHKLASSEISGEYNRLAQFSYIDDDSTSSYLKISVPYWIPSSQTQRTQLTIQVLPPPYAPD